MYERVDRPGRVDIGFLDLMLHLSSLLWTLLLIYTLRWAHERRRWIPWHMRLSKVGIYARAIATFQCTKVIGLQMYNELWRQVAYRVLAPLKRLMEYPLLPIPVDNSIDTPSHLHGR